jgi:hypothetical protein
MGLDFGFLMAGRLPTHQRKQAAVLRLNDTIILRHLESFFQMTAPYINQFEKKWCTRSRQRINLTPRAQLLISLLSRARAS